ncbi:cob(I)yrinic acid a,c-diamide adenosyltransferase [Thiohalophilus sp.]|uniref:cob(I)yrinic acid a,c-diamide adenosyltransferase n=1 Tax=Thiohalophilus sp. TaxID=3028392 RepID=UPI002ACDA90E|nr:cob(I)yrinic acid a,c-diamide adenosyltransferase [Thiohalophilus sp.]MDZ7663655.1 cob(I)yrinic acid a,c-diamide adenosyltransferase [Thiohalophilus sp.]
MSNEETAEQRYQRRMERKKAVVDEKVARADQDKGLILVHTGNGKGKSSAGFGMVARALGHNMQVGVVQFIKGSFSTGEETFFRRFPEVQYHVMGEGFTWETRDRERDTEMAYHAWQEAQAMLLDPAINLVLLDEINIALKYKYIPMDEVIDALANKPAMQHVILTGRGAKPELIEVADTVTEMKEIKHAFKAGIRAQQGVEL